MPQIQLAAITLSAENAAEVCEALAARQGVEVAEVTSAFIREAMMQPIRQAVADLRRDKRDQANPIVPRDVFAA